MPKNISYNRVFIMLQEESRGFGRGGKPTGYLKIENKERKAKYQLHVQNISVPSENKVLKAYVLSEKAKAAKPFLIGTLKLKDGCGDLNCEFNREDLKGAGIALDEIDAIVVACKDIGAEDNYQVFPLIGFKNKPWRWKEAFLNVINRSVEGSENLGSESVRDNPIDFLWPEVNKETAQGEDVAMELRLRNEGMIESLCGDLHAKEAGEATVYQNADIYEEHEEVLEQVQDCEQPTSIQNDTCEEFIKEKTFFDYPKDKKVISEAVIEYLKDKKKADVFCGTIAHADWLIVYDLAFIPSILVSKCGFHPRAQNNKMAMNLMVIKDPNVLRAVRRYGHYLVCIQRDIKGNLVNIIFGIPGRFGVEPHPLLYVQAYANWIPHKDYRKMLGGFGYWTIGVDIISGEFIIVQG